MLGDGRFVQLLVFARGEAPLVEVPRAIERQRVDRNAAELAHDLTKPSGVVGDHAVEVDTGHELLIHAHSLPSRLPSATRGDKHPGRPVTTGVASASAGDPSPER